MVHIRLSSSYKLIDKLMFCTLKYFFYDTFR